MEQTPHITVKGEAEVRVIPDQVILALGVETRNNNLTRAKAENDQIVQKALSVAQDHGLEAEHIQTDYLSMNPEYDRFPNTSKFLGYLVRKSIVLTLKNLTKLETLLTEILNAGVNTIHDVQFRTTELKKHRDEARMLAIKAAEEKAKALAGALNMTVGQPLAIDEEGLGWSAWNRRWWGRYHNMPSQISVPGERSSSLEATETVAPGEISINAKITVTFEITPLPK